MLSTYHVFSLLFWFFSFPFPLLCRLDFLLLVWKLYILLVVLSHLFGPMPYLIAVLGPKSLSTILPFSVLLTCAGPVTSSGLDSVRGQQPFSFATLLRTGPGSFRALLEGTPLLSRSRRFYARLGAGRFQGGSRRMDESASSAARWEPQTFWSSCIVYLWDIYSLLPASLSDAVQSGVPQPTKGGKQMRRGSLGKMIGSGRD